MAKKVLRRETRTLREDITYSIDRGRITPEILTLKFNEFIKRNPDYAFEDLYVSIDFSRGYYDEIESEINLCGVREETDEEYNHRVETLRLIELKNKEAARESQEKAKTKRDAQDLKEYERLKKKFGDK